MRASVSTGRSDLVSANSTNCMRVRWRRASASTFSTVPLPALGGGVERGACARRRRAAQPRSATVAITLPAYMRALERSLASTMPVMSDAMPAPSRAATRGSEVLADGGRGGDDDLDALLLGDLGDGRGVRVGEVVREAARRRRRRRRRRTRRAPLASASTPCAEDDARWPCRRRARRPASPAARPTSVVFGNLPCRCSATTRTLPMASDHLRFVVQDLDQLLDRADLAAGRTASAASRASRSSPSARRRRRGRRAGSPSAPSSAPS